MSKLAILLSAVWAMLCHPAMATQLAADLSQHQIKISTGFSGTELLLFGAADPAGDVVVVVSGPEAQAVIRKKQRVSGIWINTESVVFESVPGFFHVSATPRLSAESLDRVLSDIGVGVRYQNLSPASEMAPERAAEFRAALLRRKETQGLYVPATGKIEFVAGTLFRTNIQFPATVPTGRYRVDVYHVQDGWANAVANIPLTVGKTGLEAAIFRFATDQPALYGIFAIVIAAMAGYAAGMLFGRR